MNRRFLASAAALILSGCATDPISPSDANPVPPDRIFATEYVHSAAGTGTVIAKRDTGYAGSFCASRLSVNAKPVADLRTGERVELHLPAGDYIFSVAPSGPCGGGIKEMSSTVKMDATTYLRIGYGTSGEFNLTPTAY